MENTIIAALAAVKKAQRLLPEREASKASVMEIDVCKLGKQLLMPERARYWASKLGNTSNMRKWAEAGGYDHTSFTGKNK